MVFKNLNATEKKSLIKSSLRVSITLIIAFIIPLFYFGALVFGIFDFFINGTKLYFGDLMLCLSAFVLTFWGAYALFNHGQFWLFHQLIFNKCRIDIEYISSINIAKNKESRVQKEKKIRNGNKTIRTDIYEYPEIQFITTDIYANIPTIYHWIEDGIYVGDKIFIVTLENGMNFAIKY